MSYAEEMKARREALAQALSAEEEFKNAAIYLAKKAEEIGVKIVVEVIETAIRDAISGR